MNELEKYSSQPGEVLAVRYRELERKSKEIQKKEFSALERFITKPRLAKLVDRLAVEEHEEALRLRVETMKLTRVSLLNELQSYHSARLSVLEIANKAHVTEQVEQLLAKLISKLGDSDQQLNEDFSVKFERIKQISNPALQKRQEKHLLQLLDQYDGVLKMLFETAKRDIAAVFDAYRTRKPD